MAPATPHDVVQRLVAIIPPFGAYLESDHTFRHDGGTFTFCGVFASFSHFFRDSFDQLPDDSLRALADLLEECMQEPASDVATAAATCFLENVAGEPRSAALKPHLTGNALQFWERVDGNGS